MFYRGECSCCCSGGTAQQDTRFVVACVGESPARPFDVLDRGVVGFHFRRCRAGDNEDFDLFPPPADRAPEPVGFRLRGPFHQDLQALSCSGRVGEGSDGEQRAELFFDQPGGLQLPGFVVGGELSSCR